MSGPRERHVNAIDTRGAWPAHDVRDWRIAPSLLQTSVVAQ
ncbi:hypothetical protein [Burkholderia sp. IMCC1007]|nr:hypothetical protein [Burkholderia sp. IMCC1007]